MKTLLYAVRCYLEMEIIILDIDSKLGWSEVTATRRRSELSLQRSVYFNGKNEGKEEDGGTVFLAEVRQDGISGHEHRAVRRVLKVHEKGLLKMRPERWAEMLSAHYLPTGYMCHLS